MHIPWQPRPAGSSELLWRYDANPLTGYRPIPGVAAIYKRDNMKVTAGVRYLKLGDASAATAGAARANFNDNYAVAAGIKVGFTF